MTTSATASIADRPRVNSLPVCPLSWHYLAPVAEMERGPVGASLPNGASFVGYRTAAGRLVVLSGRCSHVGSNLARGSVAGDCLRCPLHGWEYDPDGTCVRIPASKEIPRWARQASYPVAEIAGHLFFFNAPEPTFPFPEFEGAGWDGLLAARPCAWLLDSPWHMAGSNGFDLQHFRCSHDRELIGEPVVTSPHPLARCIVARVRVAGDSWRDALTRRFAGPEVSMSVTDWAGNLVFVKARFARATSYGLLVAHPLDNGKTLARVIVFVPRRRTRLGRWLVDPLDARIRRAFIRAFLQSDVERTAGIDYAPHRLTEEDRLLREY